MVAAALGAQSATGGIRSSPSAVGSALAVKSSISSTASISEPEPEPEPEPDDALKPELVLEGDVSCDDVEQLSRGEIAGVHMAGSAGS